MPYIEPQARAEITSGKRVPETAGEMNWLITSACHHYITRKGGCKYAVLNEVMGMLDCVKTELYRQLAAPYEDDKKDRNGPVSELDA